jgi:hypothetical protein
MLQGQVISLGIRLGRGFGQGITLLPPSGPPSQTHRQSRQSYPTTRTRLPGIMRLIGSPRLLAALYGCFLNECVVTSLCAVLPLFVKQTFNWKALQAGLILTCPPLWAQDPFEPRFESVSAV